MATEGEQATKMSRERRGGPKHKLVTGCSNYLKSPNFAEIECKRAQQLLLLLLALAAAKMCGVR